MGCLTQLLTLVLIFLGVTIGGWAGPAFFSMLGVSGDGQGTVGAVAGMIAGLTLGAWIGRRGLDNLPRRKETPWWESPLDPDGPEN